MQDLEVLLATESGIPPVANCVWFVVTACYWGVAFFFSSWARLRRGQRSGEASDVTNSTAYPACAVLPAMPVSLNRGIRPQRRCNATQKLVFGTWDNMPALR